MSAGSGFIDGVLVSGAAYIGRPGWSIGFWRDGADPGAAPSGCEPPCPADSAGLRLQVVLQPDLADQRGLDVEPVQVAFLVVEHLAQQVAADEVAAVLGIGDRAAQVRDRARYQIAVERELRRHRRRAGDRPELARRRDRSEERRVGKECRSRWSPYH